MRLSVLTMSMLSIGTAAAQTCSNGLEGIESKTACCVLECGQCGGAGCSTVGSDLGLGEADCCEGAVVAAGFSCEDSQEAPCVIDDVSGPEPTPSPSDGSFSFPFDDDDAPYRGETCSNSVKGLQSNDACCVLECGQCGGTGCSMVGASLGLGGADCCEGDIIAGGVSCQDSQEAPCIVDGPITPTPFDGSFSFPFPSDGDDDSGPGATTPSPFQGTTSFSFSFDMEDDDVVAGQSNVAFVERIAGEELEEGQNDLSLQVQEGLPIAPANTASYVRLQTNTVGIAEYNFFYLTPPLLVGDDPTATAIIVEFSALVAEGSGSNWLIGLYNFTLDDFVTIGDLSSAGTEFTTIAVTVTDTPLTDFLEPNDGELLTRVITTGRNEEVFVDFTQITATGGDVSVPAPTPEPTTPEPTATAEPSMSPPPVAPGPASNAVFVFRVAGEELEEGQNEVSLQMQEGLPIAPANTASYVRIKTNMVGVGEYEIFFSSPPELVDPSIEVTAITVEFSALVLQGSGDNWLVEVFSRTEDAFVTIGDLSGAGEDFTTIVLTIADISIDDFAEPETGELFLRLFTTGLNEEAYIDFAQLTVSEGIIVVD